VGDIVPAVLLTDNNLDVEVAHAASLVKEGLMKLKLPKIELITITGMDNNLCLQLNDLAVL
tara:strand:- start:88 stop:270 length:183 start_codon:yes stop_codon:yes gene_type:complete